LDGPGVDGVFVFIIGCNTLPPGQAMKIAPLAKLDDGKLDVVIVRKASRVELLKLFPKLFTGEHFKSELVEYQPVESFSIFPSEKSSITLDGELIGNTPLHVQLEPQRINVLV
jgi:Sphingosine kinase and enzymes related to eukaryotic diacylglycerol kinase